MKETFHDFDIKINILRQKNFKNQHTKKTTEYSETNIKHPNINRKKKKNILGNTKKRMTNDQSNTFSLQITGLDV